MGASYNSGPLEAVTNGDDGLRNPVRKGASLFGINCEHDVPDESFMLVELVEGASSRISGIARYQPEFTSLWLRLGEKR